jgi:hypothetical protein
MFGSKSDKSFYQQRAETLRDLEKRSRDAAERKRLALQAKEFEKLERQRKAQEKR